MNRNIIILILLLSSLNCWSCDCKNISSTDSLREKSYRHSDIVFVGKLIESERESINPYSPRIYSFQIEEVLKGTFLNDTIFGKEFTSCSHFPQDIGRWIVYANVMDSGFIDINGCGATRSFLEPLCWNCPNARPRAPIPNSSKEELVDFEKDWQYRKMIARKEWEAEILILKNKN